MITSKVTKRGQTTIPRQVKNALQLRAGQTLVYEVREDEVVIKAHPGPLASFGMLSPDQDEIVDVKVARKQAREEWSAHVQSEG